jgi:hypothetical protein
MRGDSRPGWARASGVGCTGCSVGGADRGGWPAGRWWHHLAHGHGGGTRVCGAGQAHAGCAFWRAILGSRVGRNAGREHAGCAFRHTSLGIVGGAGAGGGTPDARLGARVSARGWGGTPGGGTPDALLGARFAGRGWGGHGRGHTRCAFWRAILGSRVGRTRAKAHQMRCSAHRCVGRRQPGSRRGHTGSASRRTIIGSRVGRNTGRADAAGRPWDDRSDHCRCGRIAGTGVGAATERNPLAAPLAGRINRNARRVAPGVATRAQVGPAPAGSAARSVGRRRGGWHRADGTRVAEAGGGPRRGRGGPADLAWAGRAARVFRTP